MIQERAAWDFVEQEKPNFTLAVVSPSPLIALGTFLLPSPYNSPDSGFSATRL